MNAVGRFLKDFPKVEGKAKPTDPLIVTVYLTSENKMWLRIHPSSNENLVHFETQILQPENWIPVFEEWAKRRTP